MTDEDKQMMGVVNDDVGTDTIYAAIEDAEREIAQFKEAIEDAQVKLKRYNETWAVDKELFEMQLEGDALRLERPVHKFQKEDRYLELVKQKVAFNYEHETHKAEQTISQFENEIKVRTEQLERNERKLEKLRKRLGETDE